MEIAYDSGNLAIWITDENGWARCSEHAVEFTGNDAMFEFRFERNQMDIGRAETFGQLVDGLKRLHDNIA